MDHPEETSLSSALANDKRESTGRPHKEERLYLENSARPHATSASTAESEKLGVKEHVGGSDATPNSMHPNFSGLGCLKPRVKSGEKQG